MLEKLKQVLLNEPTEDDVVVAEAVLSSVKAKLPCPVSQVIKKYGTPTRVFYATRHDN